MNPTFHIATLLDWVRTDFIRWTMRLPSFKAIYLTRSSRLFCHFLFAASVSFLLSAAFPLWVLAIGPVLWGLPHLISSFRYSFRVPAHFKSFVFLASALSLGVAVVRLTTRSASWSQNNLIEIAAMLTLLVSLAVISKKTTQRSHFGFSLVGLLLLASWSFPVVTTAALILFHNLVGFVYWIRATKNRSERLTAIAASLLFLLGNIAIFAGFVDPIFFRFSGSGEMPWGLTVWEIGSQITADFTMNYVWWARAAIAYAFGQSVHYFVWLRSIPEQHLEHQTPSSFRQSLRYLENDFGKKLANVFIILGVAASSVWLLVEFKEARMMYLCLVAFHGYSEFVGLCFKEPTR